MNDLEKQFKKISDNFEKHAYDDLTHFAEMAATLKRIEEKTDAQSIILDDQQNTLKPIMKTFDAASTLGKWVMLFLVALSLLVGIVWGMVQIFLIKH